MTTYVGARDALVTYLNTAWVGAYPSVPIYWENTVEIDKDTAGDSFLKVSIDFVDAVQSDIDLAPAPGDQVFGEVSILLFTKTGMGTRDRLLKVDFLHALMKFRELSGVSTQVPAPGKKEIKDGWSSQEFLVPFTFYSNY